MLTEDMSVFLADMGVPARFAGATALVLLDMPDQNIEGGRVQSRDYEMTYVTAQFQTLGFGSVVVIDTDTYKVIDTSTIDDGKFSRAKLAKQ